MGRRKHDKAEERKEARKSLYLAKLNNCPTSPRRMRLVADMIRGLGVTEASNILQYTNKDAARRLEKLLKSAIANYEQKSENRDLTDLIVKDIYVDSGRQLKRIQPAPQGRAHRIRKRSNHVTLILDNKVQEA